MDYSVRHILGKNYQINLIPSSQNEHKLIQTMQLENLEMYYHHAVEQKLGSSACLLSIINTIDRYSVIGETEYARGFGS
jgi:hypothetical protein